MLKSYLGEILSHASIQSRFANRKIFSLTDVGMLHVSNRYSDLFPQLAVIIPDDGAHLISEQTTREKYIFIFK